MKTNETPADAQEFTATATYCPEDNKLRLYVGRVPRPEYLALRAEGWTSTPKQDCDFMAHWTPTRRDTALSYAGVIEDEDASPADRAADRAERFAGYREKRSDEANGHADRFADGPAAFGFQSQAKADKAAARHDHIAARAVDQWDKAEYWQRRTAGVISHALHVSSPSVRMGRIKELESKIRKAEKRRAEYAQEFAMWEECAAMTDTDKQNARAETLANIGGGWSNYKHPRPEQVKNSAVLENGTSLYTLMTMGGGSYGVPLTGAEAVALYFTKHGKLAGEGDWLTHYRNRLAYENQMLDAQGGRAGALEIEAGGFWHGKQIRKVTKSPATGRAVSVEVMGKITGFTKASGYKVSATWAVPVLCNIERADPDAYRAPTDEERAAFAEAMKAEKAERKATGPAKPPLINPTEEDARRLVAIWNAATLAEWNAKHAHESEAMRKCYPYKPAEVHTMPQAFYSEHSKGSNARAKTKEFCALGEQLEGRYYDYKGQAERNAKRGPILCKIRTTGHDPFHLIVISDSAQKPLPAEMWTAYAPKPVAPVVETQEVLAIG